MFLLAAIFSVGIAWAEGMAADDKTPPSPDKATAAQPVMNKPWIESTDSGWRISNGHISIELARTAAGGVTRTSLANGVGGHEWALEGSPMAGVRQIEPVPCS